MGRYAGIPGLTVALAAALACPAEAGWFRYADDVPKTHQKRIETDFDRFREIPAIAEDPILLQMLEISNPSPEAMAKWILARVKVVVGRTFDLSAAVVTLQEMVSYPSGDLPWGTSDSYSPPVEDPNKPKSPTVMSNLGGAVYLDGKVSGKLLGVNVQGYPGTLPVRSPRAGLVQIDSGLFHGDDLDRMASRLYRVSTFLHEARHSDGNGRSLGFFHFVCPEKSDYPGEEACDVAENGSYALEARALKLFAASCGKLCTKKEREVLRVEAADMLGRLYPELPAFSGEGDMPVRKKCLESGDRSDACRRVLTEAEGGTVPVVKASWWDARPEHLP